MPIDDDLNVKDLIGRYGPLREVVTPLATLITTNQRLTEHVIQLAMAYGILAAYDHVERLNRDHFPDRSFGASVGFTVEELLQSDWKR